MATTAKEPKDWQCQECGKRMTLKQARKASFGTDGCPKCGGADIDLATP
jgi:ssDNA-binding Zn-finger/Zn-ribbon topoisomerase 1